MTPESTRPADPPAASAPATSTPAATRDAPTVPASAASTAVATTYAPGGPLMPADSFWQLLADLPKGEAARLAALEARVAALSPGQQQAFGRRFILESSSLQAWRHLHAAEVVMGFVSQDVFVDFRSWVLLQGHEVAQAFHDDPDSLAPVGPSDDEQIGMAEEFEAIATGSVPDEVDVLYGPMAGARPSDSYAELAARYPRLAAAYLPTPLPAGSPWDSGPRPIARRG